MVVFHIHAVLQRCQAILQFIKKFDCFRLTKSAQQTVLNRRGDDILVQFNRMADVAMLRVGTAIKSLAFLGTGDDKPTDEILMVLQLFFFLPCLQHNTLDNILRPQTVNCLTVQENIA